MIKSGDTVLILATARSISEEEILPFCNWATSKGLKVERAPNLFQKVHQFAGNDQQRAEDLLWALSHPTAAAVFCARGGYGSLRTIKKLTEISIKNQPNFNETEAFASIWKPKLFVGFSDVTVLHSWLNKNNWVSLHGPVVAQWSNNDFEETLYSLEQAVFEGKVAIKIEPLPSVKPFTGRLVGGNLSLIYALQGTKYQIQTQNAVLLLEDLDEYLYHVDRMLQSLDLAEVFHNVRAIIVGGMSQMHDNQIPFGKTAEDIIRETIAKYQIPAIFNVPIGHLSTNNSVFLGTDITFDGIQISQIVENLRNV